jgi:23S rRNA pseudouridine2605 synthase
LIRLNKYIADSGLCNRREADQLIVKGEILVNGSVINKLGSLVKPESIVIYNGKTLIRERLQYVLFNKPSENKPLNEYLPFVAESCKEVILPVEKPAKSISGLFLFTNDEALLKKLTSPALTIHNQFAVEIANEIDNKALNFLNEKFKKAAFDLRSTSTKKLLINTTEINAGNTILELFLEKEISVISIDRVEYGALKKGPLTRGKSRFLSTREIGFLKMLRGPK